MQSPTALAPHTETDIREIVNFEAPRLYAVVQDSDRGDHLVAGWVLDFHEHTAFHIEGGSSTWGSSDSTEDALHLINAMEGITGRLVAVTG